MNNIKDITLFIYKKKYSFFMLAFSMVLILTVYNLTNNKSIINQNNQYLVQYTYYYPSDPTGSGNCTGSGKCIDSFTTDENGWYYYETGGKKYLVIAAALNFCKNSSNHCGINVSKHGIATSIKYYNYFDTLSLIINGKTYEAMVLDACGACMWKRQDDRGHELFDIFVQGANATKPGSNNSSSNFLGNVDIGYEHFGTTYTGDIKKGWLYERFQFKEIYNTLTAEYKIESNINEAIDEIFDRAKTLYYSSNNITFDGSIGDIDAGPYSGWRQCHSNWGSIRLGSSGYTMCSSGCAVTSVAIQIARSGVAVSSVFNGNFNPGTFVQLLNSNGGFTGGGAIYWGKASLAAPSFQHVGSPSLSGKSIGEKLSTIASYLSSRNNYLIVHVNGSKTDVTSNHWMAVTGVSGNDIFVIDPSGRGTSLNSAYGIQYVDELRVYKAG